MGIKGKINLLLSLLSHKVLIKRKVQNKPTTVIMQIKVQLRGIEQCDAGKVFLCHHKQRIFAEIQRACHSMPARLYGVLPFRYITPVSMVLLWLHNNTAEGA